MAGPRNGLTGAEDDDPRWAHQHLSSIALSRPRIIESGKREISHDPHGSGRGAPLNSAVLSVNGPSVDLTGTGDQGGENGR